MKARFALLASLAVFALPLAAQGGGQGMRGGGPGGFMAVPSADTLTTQLSLSADQQAKVTAVIKTFETSTKDSRAFVAKMMENGGMQGMRDNPDAMKHMTSLREARTKMTADIKAILTKEQVAKYDELYPQRMGRRGGGGGQG